MDSPLAIARAIAARPVEDLAVGLRRVEPAWRPLVEHDVVWLVADRIVALPLREDRADALAAVPEPWRSRVAAVVAMVFSARAELRARTMSPEGSA